MNKNKSRKTTIDLIAPCGMNCGLCRAYGRERQPCLGCRGDDSNKTKTRLTCRIKNCEKIIEGGIDYCFDCSDFACKTLSHLDARYRKTYGMSMIENLYSIKNSGIKKFVKNENERWLCPVCGELICVHKPECCSCGYIWNQSRAIDALLNREDAPEPKPVK